jgi:TIR domain
MQIFISYAKEDIETANKLFQSLSQIKEIQPWLDHQNLLPGMDWEDEILKAIDKSQYVIFILSTNSVNKTGFVQKEMKNSIDRFSNYPPGKIFIIPIRIEPCELLHREIKKLHYVDMFPDWDSGLQKIIKTIKIQDEEPKLPENKEILGNVRKVQQVLTGFAFDKGDRVDIETHGMNKRYDKKHGTITGRAHCEDYPPYEPVYSISFDDGKKIFRVPQSNLREEKTNYHNGEFSEKSSNED